MKLHLQKPQTGFTLIDSLVSIAVFVLMVTVINATVSAIVREARNFRENTAISSLADQYLEIARNLPYSKIGTLNGNPHGYLPDQPNAASASVNGKTYQIYYVVNYIDDPADGTIVSGTDPAPNDYKQIKLYVKNVTTGATTSFLSNIAPKGLEGLNGGGALSIKVFDAIGVPIPNATINITNNILNPAINLTRTTDVAGNWVEVGLTESVNGYHVTVTKTGYSTDQTYPISDSNPNPIKSNATVLNGQATQISFSIDRVSHLVFDHLDQSCGPIAGISTEVRGAKLIGLPDIIKFDQTYISDSNGQINLPNTEWDNYTPYPNTNDYMLFGSSPIQQISVLPNTDQTYTFVLGPRTQNSLLVIVKDAATGNPIKGATVDLQTENPQSSTVKLTSGSIWSQEDWQGGPGQQNFSDPTKYYQDDGGVSANGIPAALRLVNYGGTSYVASGTMTSSTFDTGTTESLYTSAIWQPTSQNPATSLKFQIATNNDNTTWNFVGPDGTANTYFTVPGTTINAINNNTRYVRYKAFLSTTDPAVTPVITSFGVNYVSGCSTPGQTMFAGVDGDLGYKLVVSMDGYQNKIIDPLSINGYHTLEVLLTP